MADETDFELEMQAIAATEAAAAAEAQPAEEAAEEAPAEEAALAEEAVEEAPAEAAAEGEEPPAEEAAEAEPEAKKAPKQVPLAELLKEREKRQQAEQALAVERARIEERQRIEAERAAAAQQSQQQPDLDAQIKADVAKEIGERPADADDPIGAQEWDRQFAQRKQIVEQHIQAQRVENSLLEMRLNNERQAFERDGHEDYAAARDFLIEKRVNMYMKLPRVKALPEAQRKNAALWLVNQDAGQIIADAQKTGQNVAETIYDLAVEHGYTKKAAEAPAAPKAPSAEEKLITSAAGRKIVSLANGASGQAPMQLSDSQIDEMSTDQLMAWLAKSPENEARYRRMMGGE